MADLNVRVEYNQAARDFPQIRRRLPALTAQALNSTARGARKAAVQQVATELRLPVSIVNRRKTRRGSQANARTQLTTRASYWNLNAKLTVYHRGIPFFQIAGAQTKAGVKGKGGRLLRGAFKISRGRYEGMVFRRIRPRSRQNTRGQLVVDRISVKGPLIRAFDSHVTGIRGRELFNREYEKRIQRELGRFGVKT